jgi:hypothetical protein
MKEQNCKNILKKSMRESKGGKAREMSRKGTDEEEKIGSLNAKR